jgi:hypothetical protein
MQVETNPHCADNTNTQTPACDALEVDTPSCTRLCIQTTNAATAVGSMGLGGACCCCDGDGSGARVCCCSCACTGLFSGLSCFTGSRLLFCADANALSTGRWAALYDI